MCFSQVVYLLLGWFKLKSFNHTNPREMNLCLNFARWMLDFGIERVNLVFPESSIDPQPRF